MSHWVLLDICALQMLYTITQEVLVAGKVGALYTVTQDDLVAGKVGALKASLLK